MVKKINIEGFECWGALCAGANRIDYLIYPALVPMEEKWLEERSMKLKANLVMVYVPAEDWNNVLTPWPEPGETKNSEPFGGKSQDFLKFLESKIIPGVEKAFGLLNVSERDLTGVSLGGLFTLWTWVKGDFFNNIACLSGSFWYPGFLDWFETNLPKKKTGRCYFLLGEQEPHSHIKEFRSVGQNTEQIVKSLKEIGCEVTFDWVPGNHFSDPVHRLEQALSGLYPSEYR